MQTFTSFASTIEATLDLTWVSEPSSVFKWKLIHRTYGSWLKKLTECAFLSPLSYVRGKKTPSISEAKKIIEAEGLRLLHDLEHWRDSMHLRKTVYEHLTHTKMLAWNLWLDKLMDHVETVFRLDDVEKATEEIVSSKKFCTLL